MKALLFDFGGVLVDIDFDLAFTEFESISSLSSHDIKQRFQMDEMYQKHEVGQIDWAEYAQHLRSTFSLNAADDAIAQAWNAIFKNEITATTQAIKRAKDKVGCFMFSNTNPTHQIFWMNKYADIVELFDHVFVSSEMGLRKPELAAFQAVATVMGCELSEIMFFDDTQENVDGAQDAGMQAVLVKNSDDVIAKLNELNLI